jgi:hypothetical protein
MTFPAWVRRACGPGLSEGEVCSGVKMGRQERPVGGKRHLGSCVCRKLRFEHIGDVARRPWLSFPKIISAHSDGAVRKELAW